MLRELTVTEMQNNNFEYELSEILKDKAKRIQNGEKLIVKEKITASGRSIVFYEYDKKLYRYTKTGEFIL